MPRENNNKYFESVNNAKDNHGWSRKEDDQLPTEGKRVLPKLSTNSGVVPPNKREKTKNGVRDLAQSSIFFAKRSQERHLLQSKDYISVLQRQFTQSLKPQESLADTARYFGASKISARNSELVSNDEAAGVEHRGLKIAKEEKDIMNSTIRKGRNVLGGQEARQARLQKLNDKIAQMRLETQLIEKRVQLNDRYHTKYPEGGKYPEDGVLVENKHQDIGYQDVGQEKSKKLGLAALKFTIDSRSAKATKILSTFVPDVNSAKAESYKDVEARPNNILSTKLKWRHDLEAWSKTESKLQKKQKPNGATALETQSRNDWIRELDTVRNADYAGLSSITRKRHALHDPVMPNAQSVAFHNAMLETYYPSKKQLEQLKSIATKNSVQKSTVKKDKYDKPRSKIYYNDQHSVGVRIQKAKMALKDIFNAQLCKSSETLKGYTAICAMINRITDDEVKDILGCSEYKDFINSESSKEIGNIRGQGIYLFSKEYAALCIALSQHPSFAAVLSNDNLSVAETKRLQRYQDVTLNRSRTSLINSKAFTEKAATNLKKEEYQLKKLDNERPISSSTYIIENKKDVIAEKKEDAAYMSTDDEVCSTDIEDAKSCSVASVTAGKGY